MSYLTPYDQERNITMAIQTFKRHEIKFLMTAEQSEIIQHELNNHNMELDSYCKTKGSYSIYNIYFDTKNNDVIRRSLDKPWYKEKLRMRSYNIPRGLNDTVFFELKKKIGGIVSKRRAVMSYSEALNFLEIGWKAPSLGYENLQVLDEIEAFQYRYHSVPKVFISYNRVAYFDKDDKEFRISFDKDILTRRNNVNLFDCNYGIKLIDDNQRLMEVKITDQIPFWLSSLLSDLKIYTTSFSKYGLEYKKFCQISKKITLDSQTIYLPQYAFA